MLLVNVVVFLVGAVAILALRLLSDVLKDRNMHRQIQMMAILMLVFPYVV